VTAVLPPIADHDELFQVHVTQHLLLGMIGPAFLALSAPITLVLRTASGWTWRVLLRVLRSRVVAVLSWPATAVTLYLGGLYTLYLTGLYAAAERDDLLHAAVHAHMLLAGCLLSWTVIGVDPIRRRPRVPVKVAALIIAGAGHDTLAKLLYAHDLPAGAGAVAARHVGAELMYYGGTLIDLALAAVLMTQWWRASGRVLTRSARRSTRATAGQAQG
jgi:putative membrane protein